MFQEQQGQQNQIQQPSSILPAVTSGINDAVNNISSSIADAKTTINDSMNQFSSTSTMDAGKEFLQSNSLVAKFGFIILVLFGFLFLFL